jgi:integrase
MLPLNMASLVQKPNSKYYHAVFRDRTGRQLVKSTHETRKSIAQKIANTYETTARRKTSWHRLWHTLRELHALVSGEEIHGATFEEFCNRWLKNKKGEVALATLTTYETTHQQLKAFLGEKRAQGPLIDITKHDLDAFRHQLLESGLAPASVNVKVKILRMLFKEARRDGYIPEDPAENLKTVRDKSARARRPLTLQEIRRVLAIADPEWQSLIKIGFYCGLRLGDAALLCWQNVDLAHDRLSLTPRKTGQHISLPVIGALKTHLLSLHSSDDPRTPLHPRAYQVIKSQSGRVVSLSNQFVELLVEAGLRPPMSRDATGKGHSRPRSRSELSFHSLRHSAVSLMKNSNVPHAVVQALVGHESPEISQLYTHIGEEGLAGALQKFPAL